MVFGYDFSHHNTENASDIYGAGFVFLKASEGKTIQDNKMGIFIRQLSTLEKVPFIGFYHYAHPELNHFGLEANNYLNAITPHIGNCMCVLDWEDKALKVENGERWAINWLDAVGNRTGSTPIFYVQASALFKYPNIIREFPVWMACYSQTSRKERYKKECEWADFIQITSQPFDINIFKYSPAELARIIQGNFYKGVE